MSVLALVLSFAFVAEAAADDIIIFKDSFIAPAKTGVNPEFKPSAEGEKYLTCCPAQSSLLYPQWDVQRTSTPVAAKNFELAFGFRFPKESEKSFSVRLFYGDGRIEQTIRFDDAGCSSSRVQGQNVLSAPYRNGWNGYGIAKLQENAWCRAVIRVAGKEFSVFMENEGKLYRMETGDLPAAPCGFNISADKGTVDLRGLVVREIQLAPQGVKTVSGLKEDSMFTVTDIAAPENCSTVSFRLRAGAAHPGPKIVLSWNDNKDAVISANTMSTKAKMKVKENTATVEKDVVLDDHYIAFSGSIDNNRLWSYWVWSVDRYVTASGINDYVRPNFSRYTDAQQNELYKKWSELPPASEHAAVVEFRRSAKGWEFWLEGRYCGLFEKDAPLKSLKLLLPAGSAMSDPVLARYEIQSRYLPLDVSYVARASSMKDAAISLADGGALLKGIPIKPLETGQSADLGRVKECRGNESLEKDADLSRSPLDGMAEHLHYSVPLAQYIRAWVLCAAEEDPKKDPILTARLTRFTRQGRGEAIADTTITLPRGNEAPAAGITNAGTVTYAVDNRKVTVPLWLCEVTLKVGEIQDLLWGDREGVLPLKGEYLDFEFLGKLRTPYAFAPAHKPDPKSISAVHVFGVTLEKSPVQMEVRKTQLANIFDNDEKPEMQAVLTPDGVGECHLKWEIRDIDGKTLDSKTENLSFGAAAPARVVNVSLAMKDLGWYGVDFSLTDQNGRDLVRHPASFVLLGPDTRKAGYESPYSAWWFGSAHLGTADPKVGGSMLMKLGVRRTPLQPGHWHDSDVSESSLAPWKLTLAQIGWMGRQYRDDNWVEGPKRHEAAVRDLLERFPHCRTALLFHEGYGAYIVPELRDTPPTEEELTLTDWDKRITKLAYAVSAVYREKFPQLRVQLGNCTYSSSLIAMLLRNKFPRDRFDCLGLETVGFSQAPESSVMVEAWLERETARKFGFDVPVNATFEFTSRQWRTLGGRRQAEYRVRDALFCYGLGFVDVPTSLLCDPGNAYEGSYYGGGGMCERYPLLYPRPEVAAVATLTRVLDQVTFRRQAPTGSHSVYALEFERGDETVYALWAAHGEAETSMTFGADGALTVIDIYGRSRNVKTTGRGLNLTAGTAAAYVVGNMANAQISVTKRVFPDDQPPDTLQIASAMDKLADWELKAGKDDRVHQPASRSWPVTTNGNFDLRQADDPEKGVCLELELKPEGKVADLVQEYVNLKLKAPKPLAGEPTTVGIWVKGNSSWGRVMFEFEDAQGERWLSAIQPTDTRARFSLNFDGWRFMSYPITSKSPLKTFNAGDERRYWTANGDRVVQYPITLTGLVVCYPRKAINLKEMELVSPTIRLKGLGVYE